LTLYIKIVNYLRNSGEVPSKKEKILTIVCDKHFIDRAMQVYPDNPHLRGLLQQGSPEAEKILYCKEDMIPIPPHQAVELISTDKQHELIRIIQLSYARLRIYKAWLERKKAAMNN
jgi:hypothetical protein